MDLLVLPDFLDRAALRRLLHELPLLEGIAAPVYGTGDGATVHPAVRSAARLAAPDHLRLPVMRHFEAAMPRLERHFGVPLSRCEEPQFLHYRAGDFFVAHQDGNTALTRDDTVHRRISVVLFLNERSAEPRQGAYGGGELLFHGVYPDWKARYPAPAEPGSLVAFRSEATHEVTPVIHGDRFTIVSWYR